MVAMSKQHGRLTLTLMSKARDAVLIALPDGEQLEIECRVIVLPQAKLALSAPPGADGFRLGWEGQQIPLIGDGRVWVGVDDSVLIFTPDGTKITITCVQLDTNKVRIAIQAPRSYRISRDEWDGR